MENASLIEVEALKVDRGHIQTLLVKCNRTLTLSVFSTQDFDLIFTIFVNVIYRYFKRGRYLII